MKTFRVVAVYTGNFDVYWAVHRDIFL